MKKFTLDPNKPFFIYDTRGDWHATIINNSIFDLRGEYIGFVHGDDHEVYTTIGEWIGNLWHDGRIIRNRNIEVRRPLLKDIPAKPAKPDKLPPRAPLPPMFAELGYSKIDILDWDADIFKKVSDRMSDMD